MRLSDNYDGSNDPFQGERVVQLRSIPVNARILRATMMVSPVDITRGANPFAETIIFNGPSGDWGATKTVIPGRWVEVDFHSRQTLASVRGSNLQNTTLQVDFGGAYVEINDAGAIRGSNGEPFALPDNATANFASLPGLAVTKFKLSKAAAADPEPDISAVVIRSLPTNVTLRLGSMAPFWAYAGEMTQAQTITDFTTVLQAFLADAQAENGFYFVPLTLRTDTIARISVVMDIEYLVEEAVLPQGINEVLLPFDYSTLPTANTDLLNLAVPTNARVSPTATRARVLGTFDGTRVVYGPTGAVSPAGTVAVSPASTPAQPLLLVKTVSATSVDLLLSVTRTAKLQLDLREDLDGKPDSAPLLPAPVSFDLVAPTGLTPDADTNSKARWVNVKMPVEFQFQADRGYWLVLQSVEGEAEWSVNHAPAETAGIQSTVDGGLSWRESALNGPAPLTALFRLRRQPERFQVPIELQVGEGKEAVRLKLDRFEPLGRVDFPLDAPQLAQAVNTYLDKLPTTSCPESEHLNNGEFEEWIQEGDELNQRALIALDSRPLSLGMSPDGSLLYAGLSPDETVGVLRVYDVACDQQIAEILLSPMTPNEMAVSADGERVYVTDNAQLQLIDSTVHRTLGVPFNLQIELEAMALSPDGGRLYMIGRPLRITATIERRLQVIDTAKLERLATSGQTDLSEAVIAIVAPDFRPVPTSLTVAPDGTRLYVTAINAMDRGELRIFDASTLEPVATPVPIGGDPRGLALTPDGGLAVVASAGSASLNFVNLAKGNSISSLVFPEENGNRAAPVAVTITTDGARAYVVNETDGTLVSIDLDRLSIIETVATGPIPIALAITPQGDRIYVANSGEPDTGEGKSLSSIQVGTQLPAEWDLTSGRVTPVCLPEPFHLGANMGSMALWDKHLPSAISQVVMVAEGCTYDFTFWAIANNEDAFAELFWLDENCRLIPEPERIPIQLSESSEPVEADPAPPPIVGPTAPIPPLALHRKRLKSPAGATQAEIRFNVPDDVEVTIGMVSLFATSETILNPDLGLQNKGEIANWTLRPTVAPGVSLLSTESGIQLRNAGSETATMAQIVEARAGQPFTLEFTGKALARTTAQSSPLIILRWLDASGEQVGAAIEQEILPTGFDSLVAKGSTPEDATQAEIHMVVPAGTTKEVRRISLRFTSTTNVPITFISQAPGELTVLDWHVSYEQVESAPPPLADKRLCMTTPPDRLPTETSEAGETDEGTGHCPQCGEERTILNPKHKESRAGRPAMSGKCATCGVGVVRSGGARVIGAPPLALKLSPVRQPIIKIPRLTRATAVDRGTIFVPLQPFAAINGIGEVRATQLEKIGIDSITRLADAFPQDVSRIKGISQTMATDFIKQARNLISRPTKK